jgi:hypothetical protein
MQGTIQSREAKLPLIGKIKIGQKNEKGYPESLDYFLASGNYQQYFNEAFGEKPTSIEIMFLSNEFSQACWERFELRKGAKLYSYGDGSEFKVYDEAKDDYVDMTMEKDSAFIKELHKKIESKWDTVLTLTFLIPAIRGVFGAWQLTTKGEKSSIPGLLGAFQMVQNMAGSVIGIPFDLQIKKVVSNKPNSKNKFPVLQLIPNVSQGHLEKIRQFINNKNEFLGLLTENKIDDIAMNSISKSIEYKNE